MSYPETQERVRSLRTVVGNTPLLAVHYRYRGRARVLYAKAENLNLTGSIKDRMALRILAAAYQEGSLSPGAPIFEASSGNTGISFAAIGASLGHPVTVFMPSWMSQERVELVRSFGAGVRTVSPEEGGFVGAIAMAEAAAREMPGAFLPHQFSNEENIAAHQESTGEEIWWQLTTRGVCPDAFVAGVGTGGTVMGVGRALRRHRPDVQVHPLEPASSPTLSIGSKVGSHRIQGISDDFVPAIVDLNELDSIVAVDDGDAIRAAQKLASIGLGVGISSGANFLGAVRLLEKYDGEAVVVTVFPDSNKKYLSTDLNRPEPAREQHLCNKIELRAFVPLARTCMGCLPEDRMFDPSVLGQASPSSSSD